MGAEDEEQVQQMKADIAASFQAVAVGHLRDRAERAIEWGRELEPTIDTLVVAGGVAANQHVRSELSSLPVNVVRAVEPHQHHHRHRSSHLLFHRSFRLLSIAQTMG